MQRDSAHSLSKQGGRTGAACKETQYADHKFRWDIEIYLQDVYKVDIFSSISSLYSVWADGSCLPRVWSSCALYSSQETSPVKHQWYFSHMGGPTHITSFKGNLISVTVLKIWVLKKFTFSGLFFQSYKSKESLRRAREAAPGGGRW